MRTATTFAAVALVLGAMPPVSAAGQPGLDPGEAARRATGPAAPLAETGENDFRISFMEGTGDPDFDAGTAAMAYNPAADQFLVVWRGEFLPAVPCPPGGSEIEIFAHLIDPATGDPLGTPVIVSSAGPACDPEYRVGSPAAAYNPFDNEYLVVWHGEDDVGGLVEGETEIFGQRLSATTLVGIGADDFRISGMGGTGDPAYDAFAPAVAFNPIQSEYLVVWWGDDDTGPLVEGESEIFGQRLDADGVAMGVDDFPISDMGGFGDPGFAASIPAVVHNPSADEYLVVWMGDDNVGGLIDQEFEIFGQRLFANGNQAGDNDFRISDMGENGSTDFFAFQPAVTYNPDDDEYLVVWEGLDDAGSPDGQEIFAQRLDATGAEVGANDIRVSDMGASGTTDHDAFAAAVVYNPADREYLVAWHGSDDGLEIEEYEIFVQRLDATGAEVGVNDLRISDMGGTGDPDFDAEDPAVAWSGSGNRYLVVWEGDDDVGGLVEGELEIFGQMLVGTAVFADGFESGDTGAWSATVF